MSLSPLISSWSAPRGADPLQAAHDLARHLEAGGQEPHVMETLHRMTGLALVHVRVGEEDHVVLVQPGGEEALRSDAVRFQSTPMSAQRRWVAAGGPVPLDVDAVYGDSALATCEQRINASKALRLDRALSELAAMVAEVRPLLEEAFGVDLDPQGGEATLAAIDRIVDAHRPAEARNGDLMPLHVLMALGVVAVQVVTDLAGEGRPCAMNGSEPGEVAVGDAVTLGDAEGFPAVRVGNLSLNLARNVVKRWYHGEGGVRALWLAAKPELVESAWTGPEDPEVVRERLLRGLATAATQTWTYLCNVAEGTACRPTLFSFDGEQLHVSYLMAESSAHATDMVQRQLRDALKDHHSASSVIDLYVWTDTERVDALMVEVFLPGTPVRAKIMVPYAMSEDGLSFPHRPYLQDVRAFEIPIEEVERAFCGAFGRHEGEVAERLPRTFGPRLVGAPRAPSPAPAPEFEPVDDLVSLAVLAGFLVVAGADGELQRGEIEAFRDSVARVTDPGLVRLIASAGPPEQQIARLVGEPRLVRESLQAAGRHFREARGGDATREAFMALMTDVASTEGILRTQEKRALQRIERALDGRGVSLLGSAILGGGLLTVTVVAALLAGALGLPWLLGAALPWLALVVLARMRR